ncbi:MAG: hypothetical protein ABIB04_04865 [Patescibacteria group bacterium]
MRRFLLTYYILSGLITLGVLRFISLNVASVFGMLTSWQYVFLGVMVAGIAAAFMIKNPSRLLWEAAITLALFLGVWYLLLLILPLGGALASASILTLCYLFLRTVWLHDLFFLIGGVGVAIDFSGWLVPEVLLLVLVGFSIYDYVAAPPGGVTENLVKTLLSRGLVPGIIVVKKIKDLGSRCDELLINKTKTGLAARSAILGAGDVILPMTLVARAGMRSFWNGLIVLLGLLAAILVLSWKNKDLRPRAALPMLAIGAGLPFIALWITKQI